MKAAAATLFCVLPGCVSTLPGLTTPPLRGQAAPLAAQARNDADVLALNEGYPLIEMCSKSRLVVELNGPWWRFAAEGWPGLKQYGPLVVIWSTGTTREPQPLPVPTSCTPFVIAPPFVVDVLRGAFGNPWHHVAELAAIGSQPGDQIGLCAQLLSPERGDWQLPLAVTPVSSWTMQR